MVTRVDPSRRAIRPDGASASRDVFPPTMETWITDRLAEGPEGRPALNEHLMRVYAEPLKVYFRGSSFRWLGEPDDIVNGFFANRLARDEFMHGWQGAGGRLRRWLMNALIFYLREQYREQRKQRERNGGGEPEHAAPTDAVDDIPERDIDRAWARAVVQQAWRRAAEACRRADQEQHWRLFVRHHLEGQPYRDIAADFDVEPAQAAVMVRTATRKFKAALRDCIAIDGAQEHEIDAEIRGLMHTLASR